MLTYLQLAPYEADMLTRLLYATTSDRTDERIVGPGWSALETHVLRDICRRLAEQSTTSTELEAALDVALGIVVYAHATAHTLPDGDQTRPAFVAIAEHAREITAYLQRVIAPPPNHSSIGTQRTASPIAFSEMTLRIAEHLTHEITELRNLQHALDDDHAVDQIMLRRTISVLLTEGLNGLSAVDGFHRAITTLEEANTDITIEHMLSVDTMRRVLASWLNDLQIASRATIADLKSVEALAALVDATLRKESPRGPSAEVLSQLALIRSLSAVAHDRLDTAVHEMRAAMAGPPASAQNTQLAPARRGGSVGE